MKVLLYEWMTGRKPGPLPTPPCVSSIFYVVTTEQVRSDGEQQS